MTKYKAAAWLSASALTALVVYSFSTCANTDEQVGLAALWAVAAFPLLPGLAALWSYLDEKHVREVMISRGWVPRNAWYWVHVDTGDTLTYRPISHVMGDHHGWFYAGAGGLVQFDYRISLIEITDTIGKTRR